jgi:hypothetical protein
MNLSSEAKVMKKQLIQICLIVMCFAGVSKGIARASKVGPDKVVVEREARQIKQMTAENDIDGLINMLANGTFPSKVIVATYLKDTGDKRALPELERANRQLGGWDLRSPCDDRSGIFAIAIWKISTNDLSDEEKIDALLELIEGKGPIVPEIEVYDTIVVNGVEQKRLRVIPPNYHVGVCAEEELEHFDDPSVTSRLREIENKGIAPYAVWREVRDMPTDAAISRCVQIAHEEERTQQYGAIHCLRRFEHNDAVLALDILAGEGYSETILALGHFRSNPDVYRRLCTHLLNNPYNIIRLFAVSPVCYIDNDSLRIKSLATLIRATYDPGEHVRNRAAQSLSNYMYPHTESDLAPFQRELLFLRKHPDTKVKDHIEKGLKRMGWTDLDVPQGEGASLREDLEAHLLPKPYGERRGYMICTLEKLRQRAIEKKDEELLREIYTKLLILDPGNEKYTDGLEECVSRQNTARLSAAEVLRMADRFAAEKRDKHETFDLKFYPDRSAKFKTERKSWYVHYTRVPNRWPGDHFSIYVDDTTGEMKFIGGA